ncbi:MAG: YicC/YloC family endoribonuclease [Acidobacteriota bacterium]
MIQGMTGFGRSRRDQAGITVTVEVRSVNQRFADVRIRAPRMLSGLEVALKQRVSQRLGRGRVDVSISLSGEEVEPVEITLNRSLLHGLREMTRRLADEEHIRGELDLQKILSFPDLVVVRSRREDLKDECRILVEETLQEALQAVERMRAEEGKTILKDLRQRLDRVGKLHKEIQARAAQLPDEAGERLAKRVQALLAPEISLEAGRLAQEIAILADRGDITEELVRLQGYLEQTHQVLNGGGQDAGRRLDFLLQEMNREINTVGSKAGDVDVGTKVVEIKLELERIREQVQNIA